MGVFCLPLGNTLAVPGWLCCWPLRFLLVEEWVGTFHPSLGPFAGSSLPAAGSPMVEVWLQKGVRVRGRGRQAIGGRAADAFSGTERGENLARGFTRGLRSAGQEPAVRNGALEPLCHHYRAAFRTDLLPTGLS